MPRSAVIRFWRDVLVEDDRSDVLQICVSGLRKAMVLGPRRQEADRVDDRSRVEDQLRAELPDLADVPKRTKSVARTSATPRMKT